MAIVGANFFNAEGELGYHVVDEGDRAGLVVALIDFEGPDTRGIIDGRVLVTLDGLIVFVFEGQELDINLNLVARNLLLIPDGMDFAQPGATWQPADPIALENAVDASV